MENDFYTNLISQIKNLIVSNNYMEALNIVNKELNMPYVPTKIENELINFKIFLETKENFKKEKKLDFFDILKLINSSKLSNNEKYEVLNLLTNFNLRENFSEIKEILIDETIEDYLKLKIINELKKQNIKDKVTLFYKNKKRVLFLEKLTEVSFNKNFVNDSNKIEKFLFKDPIICNFSLNFLEILYLNNFVLNKELKDIWMEVIYIVSKSLKYQEILDKLESSIVKKTNFKSSLNYILKHTNFI
ncbi:MAG: hypothetical protein HPAVJP_1690 [Candidatus Hepatoplasma vulgare]|nr:MAG: hypothetical protein HPAVJP_1690 [Candidatus Hepatoplasma sp.]